MPKNKQKRIKINKKSILITLGCIVLILGIAAQIMFNIFVWEEFQRLSSIQFRANMIDSVNVMDTLKSSPMDGQKIPEARIVLPKNTDEINRLRYLYHESYDETPASISVTTFDIETFSRSIVNYKTIDEILNKYGMYAACKRGVTIYLSDPKLDQNSQEKLIAQKTLADGREVFIVNDKNCGIKNSSDPNESQLYKMTNDLEQYLTQIQSY